MKNKKNKKNGGQPVGVSDNTQSAPAQPEPTVLPALTARPGKKFTTTERKAMPVGGTYLVNRSDILVNPNRNIRRDYGNPIDRNAFARAVLIGGACVESRKGAWDKEGFLHLVDGFRREDADNINQVGMDTPVSVHIVPIDAGDEGQVIRLMLASGVNHKNLTPLETGETLVRLMKEHNETVTSLSETGAYGSAPKISELVQFGTFPDKVKELIRSEKIDCRSCLNLRRSMPGKTGNDDKLFTIEVEGVVKRFEAEQAGQTGSGPKRGPKTKGAKVKATKKKNKGQPQSGQPQSGQPQSGQPQSGQPQSGQPQSDNAHADRAGRTVSVNAHALFVMIMRACKLLRGEIAKDNAGEPLTSKQYADILEGWTRTTTGIPAEKE